MKNNLLNTSDFIRINQISFDPRMFEVMKTGTGVDNVFSTEGGIPRATNYIIIGDPGVGKSTIGLDIIADIKKNANQKVLFISAEMTRIDLYQYVKRYPKFGNIDTLFLGEFYDKDPQLVMENILEEGFDLVLIDTFVEVTSTIKESCYLTSGKAEKWLLKLMIKHNIGKNKGNHFTSFLCVQQVTKQSTIGKPIFVGSNKLKHLTPRTFHQS